MASMRYSVFTMINFMPRYLKLKISSNETVRIKIQAIWQKTTFISYKILKQTYEVTIFFTRNEMAEQGTEM